VEILCVLIYGKLLKITNNKFENFILSKGHALGILHSILIEKKIFSEENIAKLKKKLLIGNQLDIFNPIRNMFLWNSGSLGHSVGISIGLSLFTKQKVWNLIGDAELDEGSIWEAIYFISDKKINNIIIVIDNNNISASSKIISKKILELKFLKKLNLNIVKINGHNVSRLFKKFKELKKLKKSSIVICNTIKGKGIQEIENNVNFSHNIPSKDILNKYVQKLL
jgi:transketolase